MCRLSVAPRQSTRALLPNARVKKTALLTVTFALLTHSVSINKLGHPDIIAKTRVELRPIQINAFLYDIIRISAPVVNTEAEYYIYKPNGDVMKLELESPTLKPTEIQQEVPPIVSRFINNIKPIIQQENNYDAFMFSKEVFERKLKKMEENDFMLGPLVIEDHGNWVLSVFTKDFDDHWIELFQVISISIVEYVPLRLSTISPNSTISLVLDREQPLNSSETVHVSIAFPIPNVESCELVAPRTTFDRFYNRTQIDMSTCGYTIPNITTQDAGLWKIIAVGKMVYEGEVNLKIVDNLRLTTKQAIY